MDQRTEPIRQDIDALRDSMTDKMGQIEAKVKSTVDDTTETVKRAFDIKGQAAERPWAAVGLSLLAGYVLGSMGGSNEGYAANTNLVSRPSSSTNDYSRYVSSDPSKSTYSSSEMYQGSNSADTSSATGYPSYTQPAYTQPSYTPPSNSHQNKSSQSGLLDSIMGQFGGELDTLKTAAVSAVIGMLRETIQQSVPQFSREYERALSERGSSSTSSTGSSTTGGSTSYTGSSTSYDSPSTSSGLGSTSSYPTSTTGSHASSPERSVGSSTDYDYRSSGPKI